jgi:hypothetical protein
MTEGPARKAARAIRTVCLPISEAEYVNVVEDARRFRDWIDRCRSQAPELFPALLQQGYSMKDSRISGKLGVRIRRIELRDGTAWSVRPSFVMPGMSAHTDDVQNALFLRKFGVPFWALAHVYGRDHMFWYRTELALGRNSIVGTTVRRTTIPEHLLADEHHQTRDGAKTYIATTVGGGCWLGAAVADTAGTRDLTEAYGTFRDEAANVEPTYTPTTVNTDGWKSTQAAWKTLYQGVTLLACFLHAWLKIRDRGKHLGDLFSETSRRVWDAYHAINRASFSQRIRSLKSWAGKHLEGVVLENVLGLCSKRDLWKTAWDHPAGHRTSNMLDRLMRGMNRYFENGQHLHGTREASEQHCRGWALLSNFTPWNPATTRRNDGWRSPAERLNQHRYHDNWLQNLLISASCGGYKQLPHNP